MSEHGEHIKEQLKLESEDIVENELLFNQFDDFNNEKQIVEPFTEDYYTLKQWIAKINTPQPLEPLVMPPDYAIETLEIELGKIKETLRAIKNNEHITMCNIPHQDYDEKKIRLEEAIKILRTA